MEKFCKDCKFYKPKIWAREGIEGNWLSEHDPILDHCSNTPFKNPVTGNILYQDCNKLRTTHSVKCGATGKLWEPSK